MTRKFILFMLLPAVALYTCFFILPAVFAFVLSFFKWTGFGSNLEWVGLGNYLETLKDPVFWISFKNTNYIIFVGGFVTFLLAFLFSMALSSGIAGKKFFRALLFMPFIISVFSVVAMWRNIYHPKLGLLNKMFEMIGIENTILWTSNANIFWAMLVAMVWTYIGFYIIIILAGIDKIPRDLYEAAELEGASHWQQFYHITIPLIWDVLIICFTIWIILAIKNFEFPYAFGFLNIPQELYNTSVYMYIMGFGQRDPIFRMGYACAIGVESVILAMMLVTAVRKGFRRDIEEL